MGIFITVVDASAAYVATPTIAAELKIPLATAQWVLVGYLITITALLLSAGRLGDLIGRKPTYVAGFLGVAAGAILASLSDQIATLILGRVLMGAGGAMVQATSMAITVSVFDERERGKVLGGQMAAVGVGIVLGPVLAGFLIENFGWRSVYWMIGLAGLLMAAVGARVLVRRPAGSAGGRFDWTGAMLSTAAVAALLGTLSAGPQVGWSSPLAIAGYLGSLLLGAAFFAQQKRAADPVLDPSLLRTPAIALALAAAAMTFSGSSAVYFVVPFYVHAVLALSPQTLGLMLMPAGLVTALASPLMGFAADRFGNFVVAGLGQCLMATGIIILATAGADASAALVVIVMMILALALAAFHAPNSSSILGAVNESRHGVATGLINLARNMGNVFGISGATAVVTGSLAAQGFPPSLAAITAESRPELLDGFVAGMGNALWLLVVFVATPLILALLVRPWRAS